MTPAALTAACALALGVVAGWAQPQSAALEQAAGPGARHLPGTEGIPIRFGDTVAQVQAALGTTSAPEPLRAGAPDLNALVAGKSHLRSTERGIWVFFDRQGRVETIRLDAPFAGKVAGIGVGDTAERLRQALGEPLPRVPAPSQLPEAVRRSIEDSERRQHRYRVHPEVRAMFQEGRDGRVAIVFLNPERGSAREIDPGPLADPGAQQAVQTFLRGDLRAAAPLLEKAVQSVQDTPAERHPNGVQMLDMLGEALGAVGEHARQVAVQDRLLRLRRDVSGPRHPETIRAMNNLALAQDRLGLTDQALVLMREAHRLSTEVFGARQQTTLTTASGLAHLAGRQGRYAESLALNAAVLQARTELLGERHPDALTSMNNLAVNYSQMGRPADALPLNEAVLQRATELHGATHPRTLDAMNNLAVTYGALGRRSEQIGLFEKVLRLQREASGERDPALLPAMHNLVIAYARTARRADQLAMAEQAWRLAARTLGERHRESLAAMSNLAQAYADSERLAEATEWHARAWRLRGEVLGDQHPETLGSLGDLAVVHLRAGRHEDSRALGLQALELRRHVLGPRHPDTLTAAYNLSHALAASGRLNEAAALSAAYVDGAEWQRAQPGLGVDERQSLFEGYARGYRWFSLVHSQIGQLDEGLRLSELGKARTLLESIASRSARRSGALPANEQALLDDLEQRVAALDGLIAQAGGDEARQNLRRSRVELLQQHRALVDRLRAMYPKFAQSSEVGTLGSAELVAVLAPDAAAVSYLVTGNRVIAYVLAAGSKPQFVDLGLLPFLADAVTIARHALADRRGLRDALADAGQRAWRLGDGSYRLLAADQAAPALARAVTDGAEVAGFLAARLLQPLRQHLDNKAQWVVSPDGVLAQLPFDALPYGAQGRPAAAVARIHLAQSLSVYAATLGLQQAYQGLRGRRALLAIGNPEYRARSLNPRERRGARHAPSIARAEQLHELDALWDDLPGTEREVKAVAALYPDSSLTLLGPQATEQQLQQLNADGVLRDVRYLLLSAHGFTSVERPALSSIVLGLRRRTPSADGYVTASEWPAYDLRADLTVLSACDTGLGRLVGGEGVLGLPFALFVAGSANTVLTLWQVDDAATAEFVVRLFARLRDGQSASQALAETKREFMRHPKFSHPSYWAPFVLIGAG